MSNLSQYYVDDYSGCMGEKEFNASSVNERLGKVLMNEVNFLYAGMNTLAIIKNHIDCLYVNDDSKIYTDLSFLYDGINKKMEKICNDSKNGEFQKFMQELQNKLIDVQIEIENNAKNSSSGSDGGHGGDGGRSR